MTTTKRWYNSISLNSMGKTTFILLMAFPFLCVNMPDKRPLSVLNRLKNARRNIETVIGQLSQRFNMQKVRARDLWHLSHRFMRKILAHNVCFVINKQLGNPPLQFELLISSWEWGYLNKWEKSCLHNQLYSCVIAWLLVYVQRLCNIAMLKTLPALNPL